LQCVLMFLPPSLMSARSVFSASVNPRFILRRSLELSNLAKSSMLSLTSSSIFFPRYRNSFAMCYHFGPTGDFGQSFPTFLPGGAKCPTALFFALREERLFPYGWSTAFCACAAGFGQRL